jgi:hypothetical protein
MNRIRERSKRRIRKSNSVVEFATEKATFDFGGLASTSSV